MVHNFRYRNPSTWPRNRLSIARFRRSDRLLRLARHSGRTQGAYRRRCSRRRGRPDHRRATETDRNGDARWHPADFAAAIEEPRAKMATIAEALGIKPEQ